MSDTKAIFELLVDMRSEMQNMKNEIDQRFDALADDMNHRFDQVNKEITELRKSVDRAYNVEIQFRRVRFT